MPNQKRKNKTKLLLLGFGDINQRVANIKKSDATITAVRRSKMSMPGINCLAGDVTDSRFVESLLKEKPNQIVVTLSPSDHSEEGYKRTYLAAAECLVNSANQLSLTPEVIFVSSSSVYGQNSGEVIDEHSICMPSRYNGRILLEAEHCLLGSSLPTTIIRFSGIYGPGRYRLIETSLSANQLEPEVLQWTNRIHADDCARAISHLLDLPAEKRSPVYLASDCEPVPSHIVKQWIAYKAQGEEKDAELTVEADYLKTDYQGATSTGKRCNNARLLESGFEFKYPGYKEGFPEIIRQYQEEA